MAGRGGGGDLYLPWPFPARFLGVSGRAGDLCWAWPFPPRLGGGVPSSFEEDRTMTGPGEGGVLVNFARSRLCSEIHKNVANYVLSIEKLRNYVLSIEKSTRFKSQAYGEMRNM